MKKLVIVLIVLFLTTTTHYYTEAYTGKKKVGSKPNDMVKACLLGAFTGNAYFNPGAGDGDAVGYVNFSCVGTSFNPCTGLIGCQLWYESPAGWVLFETQCENVYLTCGSNQTYTLTIGGLNYYTAGNYCFVVDAMTGSCTNVGTLISSWSTYFTN